MTSQGSAHGRFTRAIHRRQLFAAEMAARELDGLSLTDALDLTLLIREADRRRYERAAVRWLERFIQDAVLRSWMLHSRQRHSLSWTGLAIRAFATCFAMVRAPKTAPQPDN